MTEINQSFLELDFDSYKESLINYLKSKPKFTDYDFTGSALSEVMDLLSWNTMNNAIYSNMIVNESFLDTAQKRDSVVSHAKKLGYTPSSKSAASAFIDISINTTDSVNSILIPKGTKFTAQSSGNTYTFTTLVDYLAYPDSNGHFIANNVEIKQGEATSSIFISEGKITEHFIIPSNNIDISTLEVYIQSSSTNTTTSLCYRIETIDELESKNYLYLMNETFDGKYEVVFGDGVLFNKLNEGNIVIANYITTDGESANDVSQFSADNIAGYIDFVITTKQKSLGGGERESIESVRTIAPLSFTDQKKLTGDSSYEIILNKIPLIKNSVDSISVWGGQDNIPPEYGTTFISLKPKDGKYISDTMKDEIIKNYLKGKSVMPVSHRIVDPEYLYIDVNTVFKYNNKLTTKSADELIKLVEESIREYNKTTIEKFKAAFAYSPFTTFIDSIDTSIISNLTSIKIKKQIDVYINQTTTYQVNLLNSIVKGTVSSNYFKYGELNNAPTDKYYLTDDENGNINLMKTSLGNKIVTVKESIGKVNYETGIIDIVDFTPTELIDNSITIAAEPVIKDITTVRNNIISIDKINISAEIKI